MAAKASHNPATAMSSAILLAALLLFGLLGPGALSAGEAISLQLKWRHSFQFAGFYMAMEKGYYRNHELDVTLIEGGPGKNPVDVVLKSDGHYGVTDTGLVLARAQGKPIQALAAVFQHSPLALAVLKTSGIRSFADLKDKRVMMQAGHMDAVILAAMKKAGIHSGEFIRQETSFKLQDLVDGNTDAFSIYITDQPHQLSEIDIDHHILHPADYNIDFYGDILITSDAEIRKHPARVNAFIEASMQGWDYALNHIDETIDLIMEKYNSQNLSRGQLYFEAFRTSEMVLKEVVQLGYMSKHRWQKINDTYAELGFIEPDLPVSAFLYKAEPTFSDVLKQYSWQITVLGLIILLLMFSLQSTILRKMVKSRTRELSESEARFRTLVDNVPGAIFRCRPDNGCSMEFISDEVKAITGYAAEEFLQNKIRSYRSVIHEDDKAHVISTIHQCLGHESAYSIEYRIIHSDGSVRWVMESGQPGHQEPDERPWIDGCIFDISSRKQAENVRRSTSEILEMVAGDKNPVQIFEKIIATYETRYPQMRASILLLRDGKLYNGAAPSLPAEYNAAIEGLEIGESVGSCGTAAFLKKRVIVDDIEHDPLWAPYTGLALPLNLRACWSEPIFSSNGEVLGTFAMYYDHVRAPNQDEILDITNAAQLTGIAIEREQNLAWLKKMSRAIEQSGEVITITDKAGTIEYINQAFTAITGIKRDFAIGRTVRLIRSPENRETAKQMWASLEKGESWQGKIIEKRKDGSLYPAMLTVSPIRNDEDEITHYIGVHEDLTKLVEMEEQFQQAQKMESIGTLVGGIAHDFNNMLAAMQGNLYLTKKLVSDNPDAMNKLNSMERLGTHAADMIQQLLTFARKDRVSMKPITLNAFMKEAFKLASRSIPENIQTSYHACQDALVIDGDATQIQQILMNLLNNARSAVEGVDAPTIHCSLEPFTASSQFMQLHPELNTTALAHICIDDNGEGIDTALKEKIFEPFFTTKNVGEGSGLGLSMVYGAIKTHGGCIDVESQPGAGCRFHIYLPLAAASIKAPLEQHKEVLSGAGETILLVDDETSMRQATCEVLESLDYKVLEAADGKQALEIFRQKQDAIDIIITDIVMPVMGGYELAASAREIKPHVPIIFSSGYDKAQIYNTENSLPNSLFLYKPFTVENMSALLRQLINEGV